MSIIDKIKSTAKKVVKETSEILLNISNHVIKNSTKYAALGLFGVASYFGITTHALAAGDSINLLLTMVGLFASGAIELEDFTNDKEDEEALFFIAVAGIATLFISDTATADAVLSMLPEVEMLQELGTYFLLNGKETLDEIEAVSRLAMIKIKNTPERIIDIMKEYTDKSEIFNKDNQIVNSLNDLMQSGTFSNQAQAVKIKANNQI